MTDGPVTVPALIAARATSHEGRDVIVEDESSMTYGELDARSRRVARALLAAGIDTGTPVGLLMSNGIDWAVDAMAVMRIGAVLVPLSTLLRPPELEAQLRTAAVGALIVQPECRGRRHLDELEEHIPAITAVGADVAPHERLPDLRHVWSSDALPAELAAEALLDATEARVEPTDDMVVMFTSGSRGAPERGDPHARRRAAGDRARARRAVHRRRRPPLHPDALLLDGRVRRRSALDDPRRGDAAQRDEPDAGDDHPVPRAGTGDPVPRLARPGRHDRRRPRRSSAPTSAR